MEDAAARPAVAIAPLRTDGREAQPVPSAYGFAIVGKRSLHNYSRKEPY
jgi:hypothetical protein